MFSSTSRRHAVLAMLFASGGALAVAPTPGVEGARSAVITVASARQTTWPALIEAQGVIAAWQEAIVGSRITGLPIVEVRASVGESVQRGALLARLDDRTVLADVAQAQASVAQATASLRQATLNRDRALALKESGAVSEQDILQAVTLAETAGAQQALAQASLKSQQVRLEDTRVLAPDSGVITARAATLGQVPTAGTELFRMIRQGRLEWRAELTAKQFSQVRAGMPVNVALPDGSQVAGRVRQLAPALDATSRMGLAFIDLPPGGLAKASMYAAGRIELAQTSVLTVPADAVVIRDGRSYVFRVDGMRVQRVAVSTGQRRDALVEIVQGLQPGQRVAVRGAGFLSDGDTVRVAAQVAAWADKKGGT